MWLVSFYNYFSTEWGNLECRKLDRLKPEADKIIHAGNQKLFGSYVHNQFPVSPEQTLAQVCLTCSAVGKDCWGWLAHTSGCSEPEGADHCSEKWGINGWEQQEGGGFSEHPAQAGGQSFGTLCSHLGWKRERRENPSVSGYGCVPQAGSSLGGGGPVKEVPSDFATGRKLPSLPSLNSNTSDGHKSQDVSLSFIEHFMATNWSPRVLLYNCW